MQAFEIPDEVRRLFPSGDQTLLMEALAGCPEAVSVTDFIDQVSDRILGEIDGWQLACDIAEHALFFGQDLRDKLHGLQRQLVEVRSFIRGKCSPEEFLGAIDRLSNDYKVNTTPIHSCDFTSRSEYVVKRAIQVASGEDRVGCKGLPVHMARIWGATVDRAFEMAEMLGVDKGAARRHEKNWYSDQVRWRTLLAIWRRWRAEPTKEDSVATLAALSFMDDHKIEAAERHSSLAFHFSLGEIRNSAAGHKRSIVGYGRKTDGEPVYVILRHESDTLDFKRTVTAADEYSSPIGVDENVVKMMEPASG